MVTLVAQFTLILHPNCIRPPVSLLFPGCFLLLSLFQNEEKGGNNKETGGLIQLVSSTKVNHGTRVTTLQLKQPTCFYSVEYVCQIASQTNKPDAKTLALVSIQLLIFCLHFLLWKHPTASDVYMTMCRKFYRLAA